MDYRYHIQPQAEEFARSIIPVPQNYPLRKGINEDYPKHFAAFCELIRGMYLDMAQRPESYGLKLIDITVGDRSAVRAAQNTLHRLFDALLRLCQSGILENHMLIVSSERFKAACKKGIGSVSGPVPRYELILSRLTDAGFSFSDFTGRPFVKTVDTFTVEYPDDPAMIDTLKIYCDYRDSINFKAAKGSGNNFHHNFYKCDYKITADWDVLPDRQWILDEILSMGYGRNTADFYTAFYEYSLKYPEIVYDGEYKYKNKRIARGLFEGLGNENLSLMLRNMDSYICVLNEMPEIIKDRFRISSCNHCGFQGATDEYCKFRRKWMFEGIRHEACAFYGFQFNSPDPLLVPYYWRLLELDYSLKIV